MTNESGFSPEEGKTGEVGSLTAEGISSLAHALNNVFAVIQLNASMALDSLASGTSPAGELGEIQAAVGRGKKLLGALRSGSESPGEARREEGGRSPDSRSCPPAGPDLDTGVGKRILFIDDERELAQLGQRLLVKKGYQVSFFTDSRVAFEVFAADPQGFDLVVTDQNMPGLNGIELASRILRIRPEIPILLCTGYSTGFSRWNFREHGFSELLVKPYQPAELLSAVRSIVSRKTAASPGT